jgi:hypothetical protein
MAAANEGFLKVLSRSEWKEEQNDFGNKGK